MDSAHHTAYVRLYCLKLGVGVSNVHGKGLLAVEGRNRNCGRIHCEDLSLLDL